MVTRLAVHRSGQPLSYTQHTEQLFQEGFYGVYAETAVFREWVDATMESDGPPKMCTA